MYTRLFLIGIAAIILSCKKENDILTRNKSATELLTRKPWILASYGYDENRDGIIDPSEENIRDCEKDNCYTFKTNGTGLWEENSLSCGNGISEHHFNWKLNNSETALDFISGISRIDRLNEDELIIYNETSATNGGPIKHFTIFKH